MFSLLLNFINWVILNLFSNQQAQVLLSNALSFGKQDSFTILKWWFTLFAIGIIFLPLTTLIFQNVKDKFYIFSKIIGIAITSYTLFLFGTLHILPFSALSVYGVLLIFVILNLYIYKKILINKRVKVLKIIVFEELLFLIGLMFWSFVRGNEPSIHGLEKFMDFGFVNSILKTTYFPPPDMWFTPLSINYYFFGHLYTAVLTLLSTLPSNITYNLSLAMLFSFTLVGAFSLTFNFLYSLGKKKAFIGGLLSGVLLSLGGNLHTIYTFYSSYNGEKPVPFWKLTFLPNLFPNSYWYPNATRFIPFTIHEFPIYSFVVSDLHGHVLDIPFVLLAIAILFTSVMEKHFTKIRIITFSFIVAIMYMTNVWDGLIYFGLFSFTLLIINFTSHISKKQKNKKIKLKIKYFLINFKRLFNYSDILIYLFFTFFIAIIFTLPFSIFFKPFVSGIGILCAPDFLVKYGKIGPFLFEENHCQHSPLYQLIILYGFFAFFALSFAIVLLTQLFKNYFKNIQQNLFIASLIIISILLILVPEILYAKDIYPQHYRANTMFKLVYQAFIMLTLVSSYSIIYIISLKTKNIFKKVFKSIFIIITLILLILVLIYPYFAIKSYYADLRKYSSLDGTAYLKTLYPGDYELINFINKNVTTQSVTVEAQGDSYTDYARISANTGLPTILGWTVHEWLWRGSYDIPSPRIDEIKRIYEGSADEKLRLLNKYKVKYIVVSVLEKQKYPLLNENGLSNIGKVIFKSSDSMTKLYEITAF